ncbi:MAG TPA: hypothetical protein VGI10_19755 [Polyangiaceae bacterium]|jgi:hypothetical protein
MDALPAAAARSAAERCTFGPWLWSPRRDLTVFGGSAAFALALIALGHVFGFGGGALPEWAFFAFVLGIDVAHVHATLFRTYFDAAELRARPLRYVLVPLSSYALGVALYAHGSLAFWRGLAYLALVHFVRQEVGWLRLYRARAAERSKLDARLDDAALYAVTLYPVLYWHVHLTERHFSWFVPGDFVALPPFVAGALPVLRLLAVATLFAFLARQFTWFVQGVVRSGPLLIVLKTALVWYVGIVLTNSDFDFTVSNVIVHGAPYFLLLWGYGRARAELSPQGVGSRIIVAGVSAFAGVLLLLAFAEELLWDRSVWHDHSSVFGKGAELGPNILTFLVPLLAVPQVSHYVLDGLLWRRTETARLPAQRRALGFGRPTARAEVG